MGLEVEGLKHGQRASHLPPQLVLTCVERQGYQEQVQADAEGVGDSGSLGLLRFELGACPASI